MLQNRAYQLKRILRSIFVFWMASFILLGLVYSPTSSISNIQNVNAAVTNNGVIFYGDTTNLGVGRARTFSNPSTYNAEFNTITGSASAILWTVAKTAPTREEIMIGQLKVDGRLDVFTCTTACDANGDYTARWNNPGTSATQDCDGTPTASTCEQAFDIAYQQLNGKAMVVYGDNVADKVYYAIWDGSAWSPNAAPGTPGVSNELGLPGAAGTPEWIRVVARGDQLGEKRSNELMMLVADTNSDVHAFYWNGSSWDAGTTLATNLVGCTIAQCLDGGWETLNGEFIALYATATATGRHEYAKFTAPSTWTGTATAFTAATAGQWVTATSDPTSDRIMFASSQSGDDTRADMWKNDGSTGGWTVCSATGCPDTGVEIVDGHQAGQAWERFSSEGMWVKNAAGNGATTSHSTYSPSSFAASATSTITVSDDNLSVKAWGAPNSDDVMIITNDVDCQPAARLWTGAGFGTASGDIDAALSNYGLACPNPTAPGTDPSGAAFTYDFAWKYYSTWQRNWRFYSGSDSANTPTTALANENTVPTNVADATTVRLRMNYSERGTLSATDQRKKLQYTAGCTPSTDGNSCTWTDVDDPAGEGIWRYVNSTFTDGNLLAGTVLTGTNGTCTAGNGCGTWVLDKDAAAGANMDHNGSVVQENEYVIQSNGVTASTTYYFRVWDLGQDSPMYPEQDSDDCGAGAAVCAFPSLTTAARTLEQSAYRLYESVASPGLFDTDGYVLNDPSNSTDEIEDIAIDANYIYSVGINAGITADCTAGNCFRLEKRDIATGALVTAFDSDGVVISPGSTAFDLQSVAVNSSYVFIAGTRVASASCTTGATCWQIEKRDITTGALVTAFDTDGIVQSDPTTTGDVLLNIAINSSYIFAVGYQSTGGACATGNLCWRVEKRDITTGALVTAFDTDGIVQSDPTNGGDRIYSVQIDASYIYLGGWQAPGGGCSTGDYCWRVEKRDITTGALVTAFDTDGIVTSDPTSFSDQLHSIQIDASYIYLGGFQQAAGACTSGYCWRVEKRDITTGALVTAFDTDGIVQSDPTIGDDQIYSVQVDASYIYLGGYQDTGNGCSTGNFCWRVEKRDITTGALVTAFDTDGIVQSDISTSTEEINAMAIDASHIYMGGYQANGTGCPDTGCWRVEKRDITTGAFALVNDVSTALAAVNTAGTLTSTGQNFRLRMMMHVGNIALPASGSTFKLQFAAKSGSCDTGFSGESYADVTTSTVISYYNNTNFPDGDGFAINANDPTHSGHTIKYQTYEELNNFTNSKNGIGVGQDGMWDFSLYDNGAPGSTSYCFRIVTSAGATLNTYSFIPEVLTLAPTTISGVVRLYDGTTAYGTVTALKLSKNGGTAISANSTVTTGAFTFPVSGLTSGDIVTIWMDTGGSTTQGSLVFTYGSSCTTYPDCTGLNLIRDQISLKSFNGASITNANLAACDSNTGTGCSDTDIGFTSESNVYIQSAAFINRTRVETSTTWAPGGNVTAGKLYILGTYTGASETISMAGTGENATCTEFDAMPFCVSGTFTASSNSTAFVGNSSVAVAHTVSYNNLLLQPTSGTPIYKLGQSGSGQTFTVLGDFTMGTGSAAMTVDADTFDVCAGFDGNVTINNTVTWTKPSGGCLIFDGGDTQTYSDNNSTKQDFGAVAVNDPGPNTTLTFGTAAKFTSIFINTDQILNLAGQTITLTGSGTGVSRPLRITGPTGAAFVHANGTIVYQGTGATEVESSASYEILYGGLTINPAAAATYTMGTGAHIIQVNTFIVGNGTDAVNVRFDTNSTDFRVHTAMTINASAVITKHASATISFSADGGTVTLTDNTSPKQDLGAVRVSANGGNTNLALASSVRFSTLTIDNSQTFNQGASFDLTSGAISVGTSASWTNIGTGDIVLSGNVSNAGAITFNSNNGSQCVDGANDITISSSSGGVTRTWSGAGTFTMYNLIVTDQQDSGITISTYTSQLLGTTDWATGDCGITISGTSTASNGVIVRVAVNGSLSGQTGAVSTNAWSISNVMGVDSGETIVVFLTDGDGDIADTLEGTAVAKYDGSNDMTGIVVNTNVLSIGSVDDQALTLTNLDTYDCGADEDVMYRVNASVLTVEGGGSGCAGSVSNSYTDETIQIESGDTLTIAAGETLSTDNLTITGTLTQATTGIISASGNLASSGTFNGGSGSITVSGNYSQTAGTFTSTAGTLTVNGNFTHTAGGDFVHNSGTILVNNANGATSTWNVTTSETLNNLTFNSVGDTGVLDITGGDTLITLGTFTHTNGIINTGNVEARAGVTVGVGADAGTYVLTFSVAGNQAITSSGGSIGSIYINKPTDDLTVTGDLSVRNFTLESASTGEFISTTGTLTVRKHFTHTGGGTFTHNGGTVVAAPADADNGTWNFTTSEQFNHFTVNSGGNTGSVTIDTGDSLIALGTFTHTNGIINTGNIEARNAVVIGSGADGGSATMSFTGSTAQTYTDNGGNEIDGDITINKTNNGDTVTLATAADWNAGSQDVNLTKGTFSLSTFTMTTAGILTIGVNGTLTGTSGTAVLSATGTPLVNSGAITGGIVQYTGATANVTGTTYKNLTLGGTGTYTLPAADITLRGNMVVTTSAAVTKSAANKIIFAIGGGSSQTLTGNATNSDLGILQISANSGVTTLNLGASMKATSILIDASQFFVPGANTITITGTGTAGSRPFMNSGTFTATSSTIVYQGDGDTDVEAGTTTYNNLTISPTLTLGRAYAANGALTVAGSLDINPTAGSGLVLTFSLGGTTTVAATTHIRRLSSALSTLTTTGSNHSITTSDLNLASGGTITLNSSIITLTGSGTPFTRLGTFNSNSSTFVYNSSSATNITNGLYNSLTLAPTAAGSPTYTLPSGTFVMNGDMVVGDGTNPVTVSTTTNNTTLSCTNLSVAAGATLSGSGSGTISVFQAVSGAGTINLTGGAFEDRVQASQNFGTSSGSNNWTFNDLTFSRSANNPTITANAGGSGTITVVGVLNVGKVGDGAATILNAGARTWILSGTGTPLVFNVSSVLTPATSTFQYTGNTANVTGATFKNLTLGGSGTYTMPAANTTLRGNLVITNGVTVTKGAGTIIFAIGGGGSQTWTDNAATKQDIGAVQVSANSGVTQLALGSSVRATTLTIDASQIFDGVTHTITLTANTTPFVNNGNFTIGNSTVEFIPAQASGTVAFAGTQFYNLKFNKASNNFQPTGTLTVNNNLDITAGTLDLNASDPSAVVRNMNITGTLSGSNSTSLTITGGWDNDGTFTHNNGTVILTPSTESGILVSGSGSDNNNFYNLTISGEKDPVIFEASDVVTINNAMNFQGSPGKPIFISSSSVGVQWLMKYLGSSVTLKDIILKDAGCHGSSLNIVNIQPGNSEHVYSGGNNGACWVGVIITRGPGFGPTEGGPGGSGNAGSGGGSSGGGSGTGGGAGGNSTSLPETFTNTNGVVLVTHNSNWTLSNGNFAIVSNAIHSNTAATNTLAAWNGSFNNNQYAELTISSMGTGYIGVAVRVQPGTNSGYLFRAGSSDSVLAELASGNPTTLHTGPGFSASDVIRIEINGTTITIKKNGSVITTVSDSTITTGLPGLSGFGNSQSAYGDNWGAGSITGGGGGGGGSP